MYAAGHVDKLFLDYEILKLLDLSKLANDAIGAQKCFEPRASFKRRNAMLFASGDHIGDELSCGPGHPTRIRR